MDRFAFVLRRPLQLVPVLIGISLITFILVQLMPGDPVRVMLGPRASEEAIAAVRARYGLDQPILLQYGYYVLNVLRADFGQSLAFRAPVLDVILERRHPDGLPAVLWAGPCPWPSPSPWRSRPRAAPAAGSTRWCGCSASPGWDCRPSGSASC